VELYAAPTTPLGSDVVVMLGTGARMKVQEANAFRVPIEVAVTVAVVAALREAGA
jgi:hypothetical protein